MGQKVNPHGARVGVIMDWSAKWYADKKDFSNNLINDYKLRTWLSAKVKDASVSHIDIERTNAGGLTITVWTAKPGVVIGMKGENIEALKAEVAKFTGVEGVILNVYEVNNPSCDAQLVAQTIASDIEQRTSFRRAMKKAIQNAQKFGALGIKTAVSGRLGGADIARSEGYHEGSIPLQTLRANIDYGFAEAATTYGRIGVKVWVYKGQVLKKGYVARSEQAVARKNDNRSRRPRREGGR